MMPFDNRRLREFKRWLDQPDPDPQPHQVAGVGQAIDPNVLMADVQAKLRAGMERSLTCTFANFGAPLKFIGSGQDRTEFSQLNIQGTGQPVELTDVRVRRLAFNGVSGPVKIKNARIGTFTIVHSNGPTEFENCWI